MTGTLALPSRYGWTEPRGVVDTAFPDGLAGAWRFGRFGADLDVDAFSRGAYNKAPPPAPRGPANRLVNGAPVINADSFVFTGGIQGAGDYIRAGISELDMFCFYAVCRTTETVISGSGLPFVCGHFAQSNGYGFALVFASTGQLRLLAYDASNANNAAALKFAPLSFTPGTQSTWRAIYGHVTPSEIVISNLTADSGTPNPAPVAINGRYPTVRPFSIGSAYELYGGKSVEIHAIRYYQSRTHNTATRAAILAELQASAGGLTF